MEVRFFLKLFQFICFHFEYTFIQIRFQIFTLSSHLTGNKINNFIFNIISIVDLIPEKFQTPDLITDVFRYCEFKKLINKHKMNIIYNFLKNISNVNGS